MNSRLHKMFGTDPFVKRPMSLIVVTLLFILAGCYYILDALSVAITQHAFSIIDLPGILLPLVGSGLLRLRPAWRKCALTIIILVTIGLVINIIFLVIDPMKLGIHVGIRALRTSGDLAYSIFLFTICVGVCGWILYVLNRRDIRDLFKRMEKKKRNNQMHNSLEHFQRTLFFVLLVIFSNVAGVHAQTFFPLPLQASLREFIGGTSLSCQVEYSMEYSSVKTPITLKMVYWNSQAGSRYDFDLANSSLVMREIAKDLAPFKADKCFGLSLNSSDSYYTVWPDLKMYSKQPILDDQRIFFRDKIKASKSIISNEENINGTLCAKYHLILYLENTNKEAFVWLSKDKSALPVKIEMEAEDFWGNEQKATVFFHDWKEEVGNDRKFEVPSDYTRIQDLKEVLPKTFNESSVVSGGETKGGMNSPQAEYFKSFLASPPKNISELVFERVNTSDSKTNIYIIKQQPNAFFFREVNSIDEIDSTNQDPMKLIISHYGLNSWVLMDKRLFTSSDPLVSKRSAQRMDDMSLWETSGQHILSEPLKMGILFAEVKTFRWSGNKFAADDKDGGQISGELLLDEVGWPKRVIYKREQDDEARQVDYKYSPEAGSNAIPCEMSLALHINGRYADYLEQKPYKQYFILKYKTSDVPLPETEFSLVRYRTSLRPGGEMVYSNRVAYTMIAGHPQPLGDAQHVMSVSSNRIVRLVVFLLMLLPTIIFSAVLIRNHRKNKK
jgi:hypothetical protein